jgi:hypothetical protein
VIADGHITPRTSRCAFLKRVRPRPGCANPHRCVTTWLATQTSPSAPPASGTTPAPARRRAPSDVTGIVVAATSMHTGPTVRGKRPLVAYIGTRRLRRDMLPVSASRGFLYRRAQIIRIEFNDYPRSRAGGVRHTTCYANMTYSEQHRRKRALEDRIRWRWRWRTVYRIGAFFLCKYSATARRRPYVRTH